MKYTNKELSLGIRRVVASERENLVLFLSYLIEIEKRELFLEEGASTIHDYCERLLGLSHGTTLKRVWVAKAASRFPVILEFLGQGKLTLTAVSFLIKHLTVENHVALLTEAHGKNEPELRWWLAGLFPEEIPAEWELNGREKFIPWNGETGKFILVVDKAFMEQLKRSKEVHKHTVPDGNALELLKHALGEDLKRHDPKERIKRARKQKKVSNPRKQTRMIPVGIDRALRERDQHQCAFLSKSGVRCQEKGGIERDHIHPWGMGGSSIDLENLRLLCFAHNRYKGRLDYKKDFRRPPN